MQQKASALENLQKIIRHHPRNFRVQQKPKEHNKFKRTHVNVSVTHNNNHAVTNLTSSVAQLMSYSKKVNTSIGITSSLASVGGLVGWGLVLGVVQGGQLSLFYGSLFYVLWVIFHPNQRLCLRSPHLPKFILLVSFTDTLLVVSILDIV